MPPKDKFANLVRFLKKQFPEIKFKVYRRSAPKGYWGWCDKNKKGEFIILIDKDTSYGGQVFMLIHELAHALSFDKDKHPSDHGPVFGMAYAKAWRIYQEWVKTPWKNPKDVYGK